MLENIPFKFNDQGLIPAILQDNCTFFFHICNVLAADFPHL